MRAALDESVPRQLVAELAAAGCEVSAFPRALKGLKNGKLLSTLKAEGFTCLVTCDRNFEWQQPIARSGMALVVLPTQKLVHLQPLATAIANAIMTAQPGQVVRVPASSRRRV